VRRAQARGGARVRQKWIKAASRALSWGLLNGGVFYCASLAAGCVRLVQKNKK
jgi:hypothetical protein